MQPPHAKNTNESDCNQINGDDGVEKPRHDKNHDSSNKRYRWSKTQVYGHQLCFQKIIECTCQATRPDRFSKGMERPALGHFGARFLMKRYWGERGELRVSAPTVFSRRVASLPKQAWNAQRPKSRLAFP